MSGKRSGKQHRHTCPLGRVAVPCADRAPHYVGYRPKPEIRLHGEGAGQRFKLCDECRRRESKDMKGTVDGLGGDLAILAQLLERGLPRLCPADVLAEAFLARDLPRATAALDQLARESDQREAAWNGALHGRTKKEARQLAVFAYLEAPQEERDVARKVRRRYPKAEFKTDDAIKQAAYRLREKLGLRKKSAR